MADAGLTSAVESKTVDAVEVLEIEDDLDTGMHRVPVCKVLPIEITGG